MGDPAGRQGSLCRQHARRAGGLSKAATRPDQTSRQSTMLPVAAAWRTRWCVRLRLGRSAHPRDRPMVDSPGQRVHRSPEQRRTASFISGSAPQPVEVDGNIGPGGDRQNTRDHHRKDRTPERPDRGDPHGSGERRQSPYWRFAHRRSKKPRWRTGHRRQNRR